MFDYCGDINASLNEFRELLEKVVKETFPTIKCTVRIRKTKAMAVPKISICILDGPLPKDMVRGFLLLTGIESSTRWAYCGKVLPELGYWVRTSPKSTWTQHSQAVWEAIEHEHSTYRRDTSSRYCNPRLNPACVANHHQRLTERLRNMHPRQQSTTMALIAPGNADDIVQIAMEQRRDDLANATPLSKVVDVEPRQRNRGRL